MNKLIDTFLADTNLETLSGPSPSSHYIIWFSLLFISIGLLWANFAVLDEVSRGEGKVIPSSEIQIIQNLEGGIVQQILVKEGDVVKKNQTLLLIDATRFSSSYKETFVKIKSLEAKLIRLQAEVDLTELTFPEDKFKSFPDLVKNEQALYESRKEELNTRISTLENQVAQKTQEIAELETKKTQLTKSLDLINQELDMTKPLLAEGAVSQVEILRLERQANDLKGELDASIIAVKRMADAAEEAKSKLKEVQTSFRSTVYDEITKTKAELAPLLESNLALEDRVNRTIIRSPVDGTIKKLNITTIGGVVQPGMDLVEIVPLNDTLLIEAHIKPADIGFIHPGQNAMVKITAYDYAIYGGLPATVEYISADTIKNEKDEHFYEIRVRTKKGLIDKSGKPLVIIPGMMATVDILTGEKTVMDYLLKPVLKAKQKALTER